jgi:hypothetical protein
MFEFFSFFLYSLDDFLFMPIRCSIKYAKGIELPYLSEFSCQNFALEALLTLISVFVVFLFIIRF